MADRVKRERKSTDHFSPGIEFKEAKKVVIEEGKGTKLGEIPNVNFKLDALKSSDELMEGLHTLLYKSKGKTVTRKREIKSFSGFVFPDGDEAGEREKLMTRLTKWTLAGLHGLMDLFDIPRGSGEEGTKEKKVDRIAEFLLEPKILSEKDLAAKKAEKKEKAAKAKERKERASAKKSAKKPVKKATDKKPAASTPKKPTPAKTAKSPAAEKPTSGKKRKVETDEGETPAKKKVKKTAEEGKATVTWPSDGAVASDIQAIMQKAAADSSSSSLTQRDIYTRLGEKYGMSVGEIKKKKELIKDVCSSYKVESQANGQKEEKEETAAAANAEPAQEEADTGKDEAEPMEEDTAVGAAQESAEAAIETEAGDAPAKGTEVVTIASPAEEAKGAATAQPEAPQEAEKGLEQPAREAADAAVNNEAKPNGLEPEPQPAEEPSATTVEKDAMQDGSGPSQPKSEDATAGDAVAPPAPASS